MSVAKTQARAYGEPRSWSLQDLLPDTEPATIDRRVAILRDRVQRFDRWREHLSPEIDSAQILDLLGDYQGIVTEMATLGSFGSLWFSMDTGDTDAVAYRNRMSQELTELSNQMLFFGLWWRGLDENDAARLIPDRTLHPDEHHYLRALRLLAPYTLPELAEQIVNLKDADGVQGLLTIHTMLTSRMEFELEVEGELRTMTRDELMTYAFSPDEAVREAAYRELFRVYERDGSMLEQIYVHRVRDWHSENVSLRGIASPISVRNLSNDIADEAVEALLDVCDQRRGVFSRFFAMKAHWLGLDRLRRFDLYAPLAPSDREVPFAEAVDEVLASFDDFHPRFRELAQRVFDQNHLDAKVRKGKRGGAFCATVTPEYTPWVLINYNRRLRDVATLAHELGHAVHSMLAEDHSILTQHPSLPLAETASVFAEMLATDRVLKRETDPLARREILVRMIDDFYATVLRQAFFVRFERSAHQAILDGRPASELGDIYLENLAKQFGDAVEVDDSFRYEWIAIPHMFNTPFYCYAYSFGQLLVLSLYRRYQQEGEAFKPGFLRLLAHGGSTSPVDILAEVGVDPADPAFWNSGFDVIEDWIDQLEAIKT